MTGKSTVVIAKKNVDDRPYSEFAYGLKVSQSEFEQAPITVTFPHIAV